MKPTEDIPAVKEIEQNIDASKIEQAWLWRYVGSTEANRRWSSAQPEEDSNIRCTGLKDGQAYLPGEVRIAVVRCQCHTRSEVQADAPEKLDHLAHI
jgi:hypothetical protein